MSDLKSQIASLLAADSPQPAPAAAPAAPAGLDYDQLASALLRQGAGRPATPAQQAPSSLADIMGRRRPTGPSVSDAGSPAAPHVVTEDTPLMQLSAEDRMHLIKTKGAAWYNATLRQQLRGTRVRLR